MARVAVWVGALFRRPGRAVQEREEARPQLLVDEADQRHQAKTRPTALRQPRRRAPHAAPNLGRSRVISGDLAVTPTTTACSAGVTSERAQPGLGRRRRGSRSPNASTSARTALSTASAAPSAVCGSAVTATKTGDGGCGSCATASSAATMWCRSVSSSSSPPLMRRERRGESNWTGVSLPWGVCFLSFFFWLQVGVGCGGVGWVELCGWGCAGV